jgi:hypothetical protein
VTEGIDLAESLKSEKPLQFQTGYQTWYTRALARIHALLPSREEEFVRFYDALPRITLSTGSYGIRDFLLGLLPPGMAYPDIKGLARSLLHQQIAILGSAQPHESRGQDTSPAVDLDGEVAHAPWDIFICHASEDKEDFVRGLAGTLRAKGLTVWYDEFTLKVGDSLRQSIDKGLNRSRFGVVVLSAAFFQKNWPQYELDGLAQREMDGRKVILPVWHNVCEEEVRQYSPSLAGRVAALSAAGMDTVVEKLLDAMAAPSHSDANPASTHREMITMQILSAVYTKSYNGFILIAEFRNIASESAQLTEWTLEFPGLGVVIRGGPGEVRLVPGGTPWFAAPPFDILGRKISRGAVFFYGYPNFMGKLPTEPVTAMLTAHLFPAKDSLRQPVDIDYIKTQLRHHQKLVFNGTPSWPPTWREKQSGRLLQGELGTLTSVRKGLPQYPLPQYLTLESKINDQIWETQLHADDQEFLATLYEKLCSDLIGKSLNEVGSVNLP